jgi:starch phosphorylase
VARRPATQDHDDALALYETLEQHVLPTFYDRDAAGLPRAWIARMREAMKILPAQFSAARMVRDYVERVYRTSAPQEDPSVAA